MLNRPGTRHNHLNVHGIIRFTAVPLPGSDRQPADQIRDGQQAIGSEGTPASRDDHERIHRRSIGPGRRKREQLPVLVPAVDPVLTPVAPVDNELEIAARQRMEPVDHPDTPVPIIWIGCSRRCSPTLMRKGSCSPPARRSPTGC